MYTGNEHASRLLNELSNVKKRTIGRPNESTVAHP
jgi:hypothetical protein